MMTSTSVDMKRVTLEPGGNGMANRATSTQESIIRATNKYRILASSYLAIQSNTTPLTANATFISNKEDNNSRLILSPQLHQETSVNNVRASKNTQPTCRRYVAQ